MPEDVAEWWDAVFRELAEGDCWQSYAQDNQSVVQYIGAADLGEFLEEQAVIHREILVDLGVADG
jgi:tripartite-type tricarboxylate transporter receptor subunit TctC